MPLKWQLLIFYRILFSPLGKGGSLLSFKAEFTCCSIFCKTFRRKISEWIWVSGSVKIDVVEEPSAGIYYNDGRYIGIQI